MTEAAMAAKEIRKELKSNFPGTKFKVTSKSFSMGNSVYISWTDGPSVSKVDTIVGKYQYGSFDGMQDLYNYDNCDENISQAKYVMTSRDFSDENVTSGYEHSKETYAFFETVENLDSWIDTVRMTAYQFIRRSLYKMDLSNGFEKELFQY